MNKLTLKNKAAILLIAITATSPLGVTAEDDTQSQVVSAKEAMTDKADWGHFKSYFTGETFGTVNSLAGVAVINPGMEIHPPHVHEEEEYLMVLEGSGEWHVGGKDFPAKAGDMLYAEPWDIHGIKNTGDTPLKFVVWKWGTKGMVPKKP